MAAENIGVLIPTKIPAFIDDADIQAALRLYHYGDYNFDINETDPTNLVSPSIAKTIYDIQQDILTKYNELDTRRISRASDAEPVPGDFPENEIRDGFVWVDTNAEDPFGPYGATCFYTTTAPTANLTNGLIWIKKGSSPLEMYVYNTTTSAWNRVI